MICAAAARRCYSCQWGRSLAPNHECNPSDDALTPSRLLCCIAVLAVKSALAITNADAEKPPFKSKLAVLKRWGFGTAKEAAPNGTASL